MLWRDCFDGADGVARRQDLLAGGLTRRRLATALRTERWQLVLPGVVVNHGGPLSQRQRWRAALAYGGKAAVLSHRSAGVLHGLRVHEELVHVTVAHGGHRRSVGFVVVHQSTRLESTERVGRIRCTSAARTVIDIALASRVRNDVRALVSDAVQRRFVTVSQLLAEARTAPLRGRRLLNDALEAVVAGTRSAGEALLRDLLRVAGVPEPEWNAEVRTPGGRFVVDALWRSARVAVEVDGARWHLNAVAWERDLRRANALQATGLRVLRFSVRQLIHEPAAVITALRAALAV
ncbi:MAG: DUF559 domain-containing protein [Geodermatophilaceae bacterium]